ncbi:MULTISPECIES: hypothetical protein [unclassified Desulfovibrio]|uniref:hypothetical protein n=1 Tax=unclassified Desulfovibrio TaxID=2593640 RepID=UPI002FD9DBC6
MIRSKDILSCLPLLASVLGEQYGVQVHIGGKTACTNGRVIYLPSLPVDCEPELLALARGFVDHEAAHIRHNDTKSGEKPRFFTWLLMPTFARISANFRARLFICCLTDGGEVGERVLPKRKKDSGIST